MYGHGGHFGHMTFEQTFYPRPKEARYEIWLQSTQWFQRRRCLKMLTYIHTYIRTTESYLYYKLTNEPKGSGKIKRMVCLGLSSRFLWADIPVSL